MGRGPCKDSIQFDRAATKVLNLMFKEDKEWFRKWSAYIQYNRMKKNNNKYSLKQVAVDFKTQSHVIQKWMQEINVIYRLSIPVIEKLRLYESGDVPEIVENPEAVAFFSTIRKLPNVYEDDLQEQYALWQDCFGKLTVAENEIIKLKEKQPEKKVVVSRAELKKLVREIEQEEQHRPELPLG